MTWRTKNFETDGAQCTKLQQKMVVSVYCTIHPYVCEHKAMFWVSEIFTTQSCVAFTNLPCTTDYSMYRSQQYWQVQNTPSTCFTPFSFNVLCQWTPLLNSHSLISGLTPFRWFTGTHTYFSPLFLTEISFLISPFSFLSSRFHNIDSSKRRESQGLAVSMTLQQSVAVSMTLQQSVAVSMALQQCVAVSMAL